MPLAFIVGAGIGGLAAGIALRRAGWDIRVFEQADAPRELGFGVGIAPNAMAALQELGVADAVLPHTVTPLSGEARHVHGSVIRRFAGSLDAGGFTETYLPRLILRPALHGALLEGVGADVVEVNHEARAFHIEGDRVAVSFKNGVTVTGDVLVGADGIHSVIRAQLHPHEPPPRPSGYLALRGVANAIDHLNGVQAIWYFGRGVESGVVQAGSNSIYWFLSLLTDDVRGGSMDPQNVLRRHAGEFDAQFQAIAGATSPEHMRVDELFVREPLERWGRGPITLLGDAAHPMLPHTGQGAAQALEDAAGLGRALRNTSDPIAALRRYEQVRARRANAIVRSGPRIARVTTTNNRLVAAARNAAMRMVPQALIVKALTRPVGDPNGPLGPPLAR